MEGLRAAKARRGNSQALSVGGEAGGLCLREKAEVNRVGLEMVSGENDKKNHNSVNRRLVPCWVLHEASSKLQFSYLNIV